MARNKTLAIKSISAFIPFVIFLAYSAPALADAWWGKGARSQEWILANGGTIIRFEIVNFSGKKDEYKVVLYDNSGKYVEVEYGTKGLFDDAKRGTYRIKADRGVKDKETYHGGKSFAEITVTAHPGETIWLKFDYKKKKVTMSTNRKKPVSPEKSAPAQESETDNIADDGTGDQLAGVTANEINGAPDAGNRDAGGFFENIFFPETLKSDVVNSKDHWQDMVITTAALSDYFGSLFLSISRTAFFFGLLI